MSSELDASPFSSPPGLTRGSTWMAGSSLVKPGHDAKGMMTSALPR